MKKSDRIKNLMPDGVPRWIRVYDNGGKTADRYTVIFSHSQSFYTRGWTPLLYMSASPFHPQGIGMHGECETWKLQEGNKPGQWPPAIGRKGNFGKRIRFMDLPADCQRAVLQDYRDYWKI